MPQQLQCRTAYNAALPIKSKMATRSPKIAFGALLEVKPYVIEPSNQLLLNKFFLFDFSFFESQKWPMGYQKGWT